MPSMFLFVELLLNAVNAVYQIKMKWEPVHGSMVNWCECRMQYTDDFMLLLKGVQPQLPMICNALPDFELWNRWVDAQSPNVRVVLLSMIPNIVTKALLLAVCDTHRQIALISLICGFAYNKEYPKAWWWRHCAPSC